MIRKASECLLDWFRTATVGRLISWFAIPEGEGVGQRGCKVQVVPGRKGTSYQLLWRELGGADEELGFTL